MTCATFVYFSPGIRQCISLFALFNNELTSPQLAQLTIPAMARANYGRVIFCTSVAAATGGGVGPHYAGSKSALHGIMHWIARNYAQDGVVRHTLVSRTRDAYLQG